MIPQRNLSLLSNRLFREHGGRRIPEAVLQRDYFLAWFFATLATHPLREHLAFKGGTALRRCHFGNYRFSEDLDFTMLQAMEFPATQANLEEIFARLRAASGIEFRFDRVDDVQMKREALEKINRQASEMPAQGTPVLCTTMLQWPIRAQSGPRTGTRNWSNVEKYFRMNKALHVGA